MNALGLATNLPNVSTLRDMKTKDAGEKLFNGQFSEIEGDNPKSLKKTNRKDNGSYNNEKQVKSFDSVLSFEEKSKQQLEMLKKFISDYNCEPDDLGKKLIKETIKSLLDTLKIKYDDVKGDNRIYKVYFADLTLIFEFGSDCVTWRIIDDG